MPDSCQIHAKFEIRRVLTTHASAADPPRPSHAGAARGFGLDYTSADTAESFAREYARASSASGFVMIEVTYLLTY